ncbi:MAG: SIMPL domain-containing protein [Bacteroidales bacterium]|nr:SIMPL domain-containing protein [Bacteroidales bacterium]MBR5907323.1 SIMPL domain-containing protein [Bacteroidales bacterium]
MSECKYDWSKIVASAIIAFGLIALGISLKSGIVKFKSMERTVAVKGLAEKQVNADKVVWRVSFARVGNDLVSLYSSLDVNAKYIKEYIKDKGIDDSEIFESSPNVSNLEDQYRYSNNRPEYKYQISQSLTISTNKVDAVKQLAKTATADMLKRGIIISDWASYEFTGLNELKPEMIAEATANARQAAQKFAEDSKSKLGKIKTASQGQFSVDDLDETTEFVKKVRVVTTIVYYLD